jgi:transposase-like protein
MTRNNQKIEVITVSEQRRRHWSPQEKADLVRVTYEPGMSVSLVARQHGVGASQLFNWRKLKVYRVRYIGSDSEVSPHIFFVRNAGGCDQARKQACMRG